MSVAGLVVEYGRARAVDGIDFSVRRGEVFGLLGTNGAGKTTTTVTQTLAARRRFHSHSSLDLVGLDNRARIQVKQLSGDSIGRP